MPTDSEFIDFVREYVRTVWAVELLLLMMADPARAWTGDELERELRANHVLVDDILRRFLRGGLVRLDGAGHRYAPAGKVIGELCAQLASTYRERPVWVVNMIASAPSPLDSLANAFRFRDKSK